MFQTSAQDHFETTEARDQVSSHDRGDAPSMLPRLSFSQYRVSSLMQSCIREGQHIGRLEQNTSIVKTQYEVFHPDIRDLVLESVDRCGPHYENHDAGLDGLKACGPSPDWSADESILAYDVYRVNRRRDKWLGMPYIDGRIDDGVCYNGRRPSSLYTNEMTYLETQDVLSTVVWKVYN